ncbi:glycine cleavage system protein GcvH [Candidatus Sumerlaeota bacterium]|nr:glycine cleavage system protein GcvH [Candidatus Sumerlaeota bacterium]
MTATPDNLLYTESHEWAKLEDGVATIGITKYAVDQLQDLVFCELNPVGEAAQAGEGVGVIESVKIAADINSPFDGEIIETNSAVEESVDQISSDPYGEGWLVKIKISDPSQADSLLNAEKYKAHCAAEEH